MKIISGRNQIAAYILFCIIAIGTSIAYYERSDARSSRNRHRIEINQKAIEVTQKAIKITQQALSDVQETACNRGNIIRTNQQFVLKTLYKKKLISYDDFKTRFSTILLVNCSKFNIGGTP